MISGVSLSNIYVACCKHERSRIFKFTHFVKIARTLLDEKNQHDGRHKRIKGRNKNNADKD